MGFHARAAVHMPKSTMHDAKCQLRQCKAWHHWTLGQRKVFSGVMNHTLLPGSLTDKSEFGGGQEHAIDWKVKEE